MTEADWNNPAARSVALYVDGADDPDRADDGTLLTDDDFLILANAWWESLDFIVPHTRPDQTWSPTIDTYEPAGFSLAAPLSTSDHITVRPRSIIVAHAQSVATRTQQQRRHRPASSVRDETFQAARPVPRPQTHMRPGRAGSPLGRVGRSGWSWP